MEVQFSINKYRNNTTSGDRRIVIRKNRLGSSMNYNNRRGNNNRMNRMNNN